MNNNQNNNIEEMINKIISIVGSEIKRYYNRKMSKKDIYITMNDLTNLVNSLTTTDYKKAGQYAITKLIPMINLIIKQENDNEYKAKYLSLLEESYRIGARIDFGHFLVYYEWDSNDKIYEYRFPILRSYVYYLNKMCFDPTFELVIANLPSGYGKSRIAKLYEAFRLGVDPTGTFLSLCSNDTVVKGGSRSVIDIIKNERYGQIFPDLDYSKMKKDLFLKETDGEWKLKYCSMMASYYASTTNSNVVGQRASLSIHIDDLYADYKEALDEKTNEYYYNKYVSVWKERFVKGKKPQIIISGTLWSPTDFIKKVIDLTKKESEFIPHPKFKYTLISKDGKKVIIQVPAIDEDTGESSCPDLISTKELLRKKNSMDTYLWETNFQQKPTSPEGLEFDWNKLKTYDYVPDNKYNCSFAVIDGTRKSGKDFFSMPIFQYANEEKTEYLLVDCIFTKTATSELINDILDKIVENRIITLVIETNVDGGLKKVLEEKFDEYGIDYCTVIEKYNTITKSIRIEAEKGRIVKYIRFPSREMFGLNSDMGKMMSNLTTYSTLSKNRNDDSPDSMAMFTSEIVGEKAKPRRAMAVKRL